MGTVNDADGCVMPALRSPVLEGYHGGEVPGTERLYGSGILCVYEILYVVLI